MRNTNMGKLYAIVGRPGTGKSAYLNKMKAASGNSIYLFKSSDYADHHDLLEKMTSLAQNDTLKIIGVDDYEYKLMEMWGGTVDNPQYMANLQKLSAFAKSHNTDLYIAVGLNRNADLNNSGSISSQHLRTKAIVTETDGILFLK